MLAGNTSLEMDPSLVKPPSLEMYPIIVKPQDDNIPVYETEARSFTSMLVSVMRKLQFFSKVGLVIWPLFGVSSSIFANILILKWPSDIAELIKIIMFFIYIVEMFFIPISVYLLERRVPDLFKRRNLKPPLYTWFLVLPFSLNTITHIYRMVIGYPSVADQSAGKIVAFFAVQFANLLGTSVYYAIPPFFVGVMASNFMEECGSVNKDKNIFDRQAATKGTQILEVYSSLQEGAQFGLFSQFTVHTLLAISLGFLISVSGKCLDLDSSFQIVFVTALVMSVMILCYFGFIMDDCYQRFQGTADKLREVYVRSTDLQFSKELLVLIQLIEKQAPFSALGFFTVDRSTLMAELGTVLTYFVILIQADVCSPKVEPT